MAKRGVSINTQLDPSDQPEGWEYAAWLLQIQETFARAVRDGEPLFTTDVKELYNLYLQSLPIGGRQHHRCTACQQFIEHYGGLVRITDRGRLVSVLWEQDYTPDPYLQVSTNMSIVVGGATVTGVFYTSEVILGKPVTGSWEHFAVSTTGMHAHRFSHTLTADQAMAEKLEDFRTLKTALDGYSDVLLGQALTLLQSDRLYRSEKVLGVAEWLFSLKKQLMTFKDQERRDNYLWKAVATAPTGYCHPRSSMIGTLLDDLARRYPLDVATERFQQKMDPEQYQRPQTYSEGTVAQAEKVFERLKTGKSLRRRYATVHDVEHRALWMPRGSQVQRRQSAPGLFADLAPSRSVARPQPFPMQGGRYTMTWEKFAREVLPRIVQQLYIEIPGVGAFAGMATAVDDTSPPIIQWDREEQRNPVSWYLYSGGSSAEQWSVTPRTWKPVSVVCLSPNLWYKPELYAHQGHSVFFGIPGAKDIAVGGGCGLFPEILKSEYHGVRGVIEAYSRSHELEGSQEMALCGLMAQKGKGGWPVNLQVVINNMTFRYTLDRWD